ncbi:unnamed protein product [Prorocentrum cordatum]|uniref:Uncharacterized protein n=1 Tax=Prorocentrum cordatum TaxID=2364126 RepID=A0ABN9UE20_9DINO|nr:unnamed protein product [Polarella glacialis]
MAGGAGGKQRARLDFWKKASRFAVSEEDRAVADAKVAALAKEVLESKPPEAQALRITQRLTAAKATAFRLASVAEAKQQEVEEAKKALEDERAKALADATAATAKELTSEFKAWLDEVQGSEDWRHLLAMLQGQVRQAFVAPAMAREVLRLVDVLGTLSDDAFGSEFQEAGLTLAFVHQVAIAGGTEFLDVLSRIQEWEAYWLDAKSSISQLQRIQASGAILDRPLHCLRLAAVRSLYKDKGSTALGLKLRKPWVHAASPAHVVALTFQYLGWRPLSCRLVRTAMGLDIDFLQISPIQVRELAKQAALDTSDVKALSTRFSCGALDPTDEERSAIHNIDDLFVWLGLTSTDGPEKESAVQLLGIEPGDPLRDLANIQESNFNASLDSWVTNFDAATTHAASPTNTGRLRNAWRIAAVMSGTHISVAQQHQLFQLDLVVDQALSREVTSLSDKEIQDCFVECKRRMGAMPTEEEEPDAEQLIGATHLLRSGAPPCVDFPLFGPRQLRSPRKLKFSCLILSADGVFQSVELLGPPTLEDWAAACRLLGAGLIMLKAVAPARIQRCQQRIFDGASRLSSAVWSIMCQADVRMHHGHVQAPRRLALEQNDAGPVAAANRGITGRNVGEGGLLKASRGIKSQCRLFQTGACAHALRGAMVCARGNSSMRECGECFSPGVGGVRVQLSFAGSCRHAELARRVDEFGGEARVPGRSTDSDLHDVSDQNICEGIARELEGDVYRASAWAPPRATFVTELALRSESGPGRCGLGASARRTGDGAAGRRAIAVELDELSEDVLLGGPQRAADSVRKVPSLGAVGAEVREALSEMSDRHPDMASAAREALGQGGASQWPSDEMVEWARRRLAQVVKADDGESVADGHLATIVRPGLLGAWRRAAGDPDDRPSWRCREGAPTGFWEASLPRSALPAVLDDAEDPGGLATEEGFGNPADVEDDDEAAELVAEHEKKGCVVGFATQVIEEERLAKIRWGIAFNCRWGGLAAASQGSERAILPRISTVAFDSFELSVQPGGLFFAAELRGRLFAILRAAQGSRGAPLLWAMVAALVRFLTQGALVLDVALLSCCVDDPVVALAGAPRERACCVALVVYCWLSLGFPLSFEKGLFGDSVAWAPSTFPRRSAQVADSWVPRARVEIRVKIKKAIAMDVLAASGDSLQSNDRICAAKCARVASLACVLTPFHWHLRAGHGVIERVFDSDASRGVGLQIDAGTDAGPLGPGAMLLVSGRVDEFIADPLTQLDVENFGLPIGDGEVATSAGQSSTSLASSASTEMLVCSDASEANGQSGEFATVPCVKNTFLELVSRETAPSEAYRSQSCPAIFCRGTAQDWGRRDGRPADPAAARVAGDPAAQAAAGRPLAYPALPSEHEARTCRPCVFFHAQRCANDLACSFCHLCDAGEIRGQTKTREARRDPVADQGEAGKAAEGQAGRARAVRYGGAFGFTSASSMEFQCFALGWALGQAFGRGFLAMRVGESTLVGCLGVRVPLVVLLPCFCPLLPSGGHWPTTWQWQSPPAASASAHHGSVSCGLDADGRGEISTDLGARRRRSLLWSVRSASARAMKMCLQKPSLPECGRCKVEVGSQRQDPALHPDALIWVLQAVRQAKASLVAGARSTVAVKDGAWMYGDYIRLEGAHDVTSCHQACEADPQCYHWNLHVLRHSCDLKGSDGFHDEKHDWVSGDASRFKAAGPARTAEL